MGVGHLTHPSGPASLLAHHACCSGCRRPAGGRLTSAPCSGRSGARSETVRVTRVDEPALHEDQEVTSTLSRKSPTSNVRGYKELSYGWRDRTTLGTARRSGRPATMGQGGPATPTPI